MIIFYFHLNMISDYGFCILLGHAVEQLDDLAEKTFSFLFLMKCTLNY